MVVNVRMYLYRDAIVSILSSPPTMHLQHNSWSLWRCACLMAITDSGGPGIRTFLSHIISTLGKRTAQRFRLIMGFELGTTTGLNYCYNRQHPSEPETSWQSVPNFCSSFWLQATIAFFMMSAAEACTFTITMTIHM